jgi:uncharacterized protein YceK
MRAMRLVGLLAMVGLVMSGCAGVRKAQRPTNTEVQILAQSCFYSEIVPCG